MLATVIVLAAGLNLPVENFRIHYERDDTIYGRGPHAVDPRRDIREDYRDPRRDIRIEDYPSDPSRVQPPSVFDRNRDVTPCTRPELFWPPATDCKR